jgi:hypothetical protein
VKKEFLSYRVVRDNAIKLAYKIYSDGFSPDIIYVSLRGGAYIGNVISEYFKIVRKDRRPVFYAAVVARSYVDINKREKVQVDGWTYDPEYLRNGDKVLFLDDIFDSGRTINHLVGILIDKGVPRQDIKIAVHDYKLRTYVKKQLAIQPDYYCRKLLVTNPKDDIWIHYMSHELEGLTLSEQETYYGSNDPELQQAFGLLRGKDL